MYPIGSIEMYVFGAECNKMAIKSINYRVLWTNNLLLLLSGVVTLNRYKSGVAYIQY